MARAGNVADNDVLGAEMLLEEPTDQARIGIVAPAGIGRDDVADVLAAVEARARIRSGPAQRDDGGEQEHGE